ncbi:hypothetical protein [uncultured Corynebacterium sp.]|uniref:hypothetical protein n=1 Tax=uncultured Corynebacterium sp. TaxID=159447 RepID=UPI0025EF10C1|nr:hypothetical protein [uncultured Corynebacterium sp.]
MNAYAVSRRSAATILAVAALALGACSDTEDSGPAQAPPTTTPDTTSTSEHPSPTSEAPPTSTATSSVTTSSSEESSAPEAATQIDAAGISFSLDGVAMMCWVGEMALLNCQSSAQWAPTSGNGPANSLSFDMNTESIQALQANANMADLDIAEVDGGGRYEVKNVIFDITESDRMTFSDELSGKSGYITADRYGWS